MAAPRKPTPHADGTPDAAPTDATTTPAAGPGTPDAVEPLGRAPRMRSDGTAPAGPVAAATALAQELADAFRNHVRRALGTALDDTETSLAFVDHYLRTTRKESRPAILALIAAEAGAYYGELVRTRVGGTWIGDGHDPRRLRLLLRDQFLHFAPIDQAFEVLLGPDADDGERFADATPLDTAFHARPTAAARVAEAGTEGEDPDDASWLADRLAERPAVGEDEYYTLTCRFETLELVLELLAAKHVGEGRSPREYDIADYVDVLAQRN